MPSTAAIEEHRLDEYLEHLASTAGHQDRREPLSAYLAGLCPTGKRKSIGH